MSEHLSNNIDVSEVLRKSQLRLARKKIAKRNTLILLVFSLLAYLLFRNVVDADSQGYLPSDLSGNIKSVESFKKPLLPYEERLAHATYIVQSLNSLSYYDKDEVLSKIERYFSPNVFKGYILSQYNNGFFNQMIKYRVSYIAKLEPAYLNNDSPVPVMYTAGQCYEAGYMGDSIKAGIDCRYSKPTNRYSETFFFKVNRFLIVKDKATKLQEFKVRLVLTRVDDALFEKGYLVSEYTEI